MANKPLASLNIEHLIKNVVNDRLMMQLAKLAVEMIRTRTRLGKGVPELGAAQQSLDKLETQTKTNRRNMKKRGTLSGQTTPAKSNLTATGEMLDSIKFVVEAGKIEVYIAGQRNRQVAEYVGEQRPFFTLSKAEVSRLADVIQLAINTYLKKGT